MCIQTHEIITIFVWNIAFTVTYSGQKVENIPQTHKKLFKPYEKNIRGNEGRPGNGALFYDSCLYSC